MSDALVDFTSGVSEVIDLEANSAILRSADSEDKKSLFKTLTNEIEDHALMCAAIKVRVYTECVLHEFMGLQIHKILRNLRFSNLNCVLFCYRLRLQTKWRRERI